MMTVVLIDDERPALKIMGILLSKYPQIKITGQFINPVKALEEMKTLQPDVVFLDIDMPYMNGMEAASGILEISPNTRIVFITAHEKYALGAYQFHPMDYILKPVVEERLDNLIEYLQRSNQKVAEETDKKLMIRCFGDFFIKWENEEPVKWRTEKTKEILAYLVDNYDRNIEKEEILDSLWPEYDPDRAMKQLYNGIYYIRRTFSEYGVGNRIIIDKSYNVKFNDVDFDINHLKKLKCDCDFEDIDKIMEGMYFERQDYLWVREKREAYFLIHLQCLLKLATGYQENKQYEQAEKLYLKAFKKDTFNEAVAENLLRLYFLTNDKIKGMRFYQEYEKMIKAELNEKPSAKMAECYGVLKRL